MNVITARVDPSTYHTNRCLMMPENGGQSGSAYCVTPTSGSVQGVTPSEDFNDANRPLVSFPSSEKEDMPGALAVADACCGAGASATLGETISFDCASLSLWSSRARFEAGSMLSPSDMIVVEMVQVAARRLLQVVELCIYPAF